MKFTLSIFNISVLSIFFSCSSSTLNNYWPYSQLPPTKVKLLQPNSYEEIIPALDSVLSPSAKEHFKNQSSEIAVIEICQQIGVFFITNWKLNLFSDLNNWPNKNKVKLPKTQDGIAFRFFLDRIEHPEAMVRIMLSGYHNHLHNKKVDWPKLIAETKSIWPKTNLIDFDSSLPKEIERLEDSVYSAFRFEQLSPSDTVNILINRKPQLSKQSSDWYYLTGVINYKLNKSKSINISITNIESELNQNYLITEKDTLHIGDTITDYHAGWLSKNVYYFNYNRCQEYRLAFNTE